MKFSEITILVAMATKQCFWAIITKTENLGSNHFARTWKLIPPSAFQKRTEQHIIISLGEKKNAKKRTQSCERDERLTVTIGAAILLRGFSRFLPSN